MDPYGSERQWYWVGMVVLALGAIAMVLRARGKSRDSEPHHVYHIFVCFTAAIFYLMMAMDQTRVEIPAESRHLYVARFVDWSITTPLLLLGLSTTALGALRRRSALVVGLLLADVAIMLTGLAATLSHVQGAKVAWYIVSCTFQVAVYTLVWGPLRREATGQRTPTVGAVFTRNATLLSVLWLAYPLIWLGAPSGFRLYEAPTAALLYMVFDIIAKVGYGFITLAGSTQLEPHAAHYRPVVEPIASVPADRAA
ncbi:hypothetical protein tb265_47650 [Gemmatimonadetes bacterium T265]|nr:hypothetical protein tb265_47650 [Gemmatimonadetes bacterium T265]